jgi:hypothetical protein
MGLLWTLPAVAFTLLPNLGCPGGLFLTSLATPFYVISMKYL